MRQCAGCLVFTLSSLRWWGLGSTLLMAFCSYISSGVRSALTNCSSLGWHRCGGILSWMRGHTLCFRMNENWSVLRVWLRNSRWPAVLAVTLCAHWRHLNSSVIANSSPFSNFLKLGIWNLCKVSDFTCHTPSPFSTCYLWYHQQCLTHLEWKHS